MKKIGLFFGGMGNEAEVSIVSAKNIIKNFDYKRYELKLVYWHKDGLFYFLKNINELKKLNRKSIISQAEFGKKFEIGLLMTHGKYGEDGVLQGILEALKIKYCGCRVLSSALCMDKAVFKKYLAGAGVAQVKFETFDYDLNAPAEIKMLLEKVKNDFKFPLYIKPANSGSSVGITKVEKADRLDRAIKEAAKHDSKIIIEEGLVGARELEAAVLGNDKLIISDPGELILAKEFYDYDDKYKLGQTGTIIPAKLEEKTKAEIISLAKKVYQLCSCSGFARVDFFLKNGKVYLNEINTLPGFTDISMYPMLMMSTGMSYRELINKIIKLAY